MNHFEVKVLDFPDSSFIKLVNAIYSKYLLNEKNKSQGDKKQLSTF